MIMETVGKLPYEVPPKTYTYKCIVCGQHFNDKQERFDHESICLDAANKKILAGIRQQQGHYA